MMKYEIREYKLKNGMQGLSIIFEEEKYQLLSMFLGSDVKQFAEWIKQEFDKVISGRSEYEKISGNVCSIEITPDMTRIYDDLAENPMEDFCEINTVELRELIEKWCSAVSEYKNNN